MFKKLLSFLIVSFILIGAGQLVAQQDIKKENIKKKFMQDHLQHSSQGKEFWLAIPPNECDGQPVGNTHEIGIEIYVTASKATLAKLEMPGEGFIKTKQVQAMDITTFSSKWSEASFLWEVRESEVIKDLGFKVSADQPLSVYVMNNRNVTSEGYLAIPAASCGTDYIHLCYYDFWEPDYPCQGNGRGSGFIIIPTLDNTECLIQLKGRGKDYSQTVAGRKIGENWKVNVNRGQVYMVMGEGKTRGTFDISGSRIKGNKPFGLISFHVRTLLPSSDLWNGRDNMMEMLPPVSAWGNRYVTCELKRYDRGDFFRIIAAEDNTKFSVRWYDIRDGNLIGRRDQTLRYSGDFAEYEEVYVHRNDPTNHIPSIRGTSVWEADKPVLVMQYSYSLDWDGEPNFDPFMFLVVPEEQYVENTVFQTPDKGSEFNVNWFNIVAVGDTTDDNQELLRSIKIDGRPIWVDIPGFLLNRIPTTNQYWAKIPVEPGAHVVTSDTRFGGYIYGFSYANSYGWPAAMAVRNLEETDTLPPVLSKTGTCGTYIVQATEYRNGEPKDNPRQVDQGVSAVELLPDYSYNYLQPTIIEPDPFEPYPPVYFMRFRLNVEDPYMDAKAVFAVIDRAGNVSIDSVYYEADSLTLNPNPVDFGRLRMGEDKKLVVDLKSESDSVITIKSLKLKYGTAFEMTRGSVAATAPLKLPSRQIHEMDIVYTPSRTAATPDDFEVDTILVQTECVTYEFPVKGMAGIPHIWVADFDAGTIMLGNKKCISEISQGLEIFNPGSDTLEIYAIKNVSAPFTLSNPTIPPLPIFVPPGERVYLKEICFEPTETGDYRINVEFEHNAGDDPNDKDISLWRGICVTTGPYITGYDWNERRVKTAHRAEVYLKNKGDAPILVTGVKLLEQSENNFRIMQSEIKPSLVTPVTLYHEGFDHPDTVIVIPVEFEPLSEFDKEIRIVAEFDPSYQIPEGSVYNYLRGIGILPKLTAVGYEFKPQIMINTTHPDVGKVVITNPSKSAQTHIYEIKVNASSPSPQDFEWVSQLPKNINIPKEGTLELDVLFKPLSIGRRVVSLDIISDAVPGPTEPFRTEVTVDVIGNAYDKGLETGPWDFGNVLICNHPEATIPITNTAAAGSDPALIYSVELISGDTEVFEILSFPSEVPAQTTINVPVRFNPSVRGPGTYQAVVEIKSNVAELTTTLKGVGYNVNVKLSQKDIHSAPGAVTLDRPPQYPFPDFPVFIESNNWNDAQITNIEFELVYQTAWMRYDGNIAAGSVIGNWNVTAREERIDDISRKLVVSASGNSPINQNGILVKPVFQLLLSDSARKFTPRFGKISLKDRDACVVPNWAPGTVTLESCVLDLRNVVISGTKYSLQKVEQNPITSGAFTLKFGVGLSGPTTIEMINSLGEVVSVIASGVMQSGSYEMDVNASRFPSGMYYIRMSSGEFKDVQKIVIAK